jgi:hypothetical protein
VSSIHKAVVLAGLKHSPLNLADLNFNQELIIDNVKIKKESIVESDIPKPKVL